MQWDSSGAVLSLVATAVGIGTAALGVSSLIGPGRRIVPFSGGLLMGVAVFAVAPELAEAYGWKGAILLLTAGIGLLWVFSRYVYPVCPSCSHTHDHGHCATALHGFALPLISAASLHAFLDGLGVGASQHEHAAGSGAVLVLGVILHKIPEGLALGVMLRAAVRSRLAAFGWCAAAESATLAGGLLENVVTGWFGVQWVSYALALAGGSFLYLGFHAIHGEWQRRGTPAFIHAITGAAGAAALQQGLRLFMR